jgi:hypothetical protein
MFTITLHRLYLRRIIALVVPVVLMLKLELQRFYDDAAQPVVLTEFCCSLEPA